MKNAIILAAGKSERFAPFTYERPKGLFCVKGEILIERQIRQLNEAGVYKIYVVVGYMKEKFFYLERKYGVELIVNNTFAKKGNVYSLYSARKYLGNTFVCCADHYFEDNPFLEENINNFSYRQCSFQMGKFREFAVTCSDADVITSVEVGGENQMAMVGMAYFNKAFSDRFVEYMEKEIDDFGIANMFWEEFYAKHQKHLTLYAKYCEPKNVLEFDCIDDLRQFDSEFLENVDSEIIMNICKTIHCNPSEIVNIQVIQAGLTNVSFEFTVGNIRYVYRHPGGSSGRLIDRKTELLAEKYAKMLDIDGSIIKMDEAGWKISYYVSDLVNCDFLENRKQLISAMKQLKKMHSVKVEDNVRFFDTVQEGKKLMKIASASKGNLFVEFNEIIVKINKLDKYVKEEAQKYNMQRVLCHNDVYEPNFLATLGGKMYLIDWEYAGLNDPANDIACILCRRDYSDDDVERILEAYFERKLTDIEHRHYIAYIALCGFYWFCWGLYKGSVGDDDGFFFLPAYRNCIRYLDQALEMYSCKKTEEL